MDDNGDNLGQLDFYVVLVVIVVLVVVFSLDDNGDNFGQLDFYAAFVFSADAGFPGRTGLGGQHVATCEGASGERGV